MAAKEKPWTTSEVLRRTGRSPEPGELFWFLFDEHDEIVARQASGRFSWDSMLFATQAMDLQSASGKPVRSIATLRRTLDLVVKVKRWEAETKQNMQRLLRTPVVGHA